MPKPRGNRGCCDRCAGVAGTADAARIARRRLLKDAVFRPQPGLVPAAVSGPSWYESSGAEPGQLPGQAPLGHGPGFADATLLPRAITGEILDVSPHILVLGEREPGGSPDSEHRYTLTADARCWRGGPVEPTALHQGDRVVVRLQAGKLAIADRIWAGIGRVTGTIVEHAGEFIVVDEGVTRPRQLVVIPPRAISRIQVKFPTLQPGFLLDVIGLRGPDHLEGLVPATFQPSYAADRLPVPPLVSGHVPDAIGGSATWHEPAPGEPGGVLGLAYPALDPETNCAEDAAAGRAGGYARMPYLAIGSSLLVRNECSKAACFLPVTGCAAVARLFNDRCVTCGTSARGRVADLTLASFVSLGGELDRGCFNATITMGG